MTKQEQEQLSFYCSGASIGLVAATALAYKQKADSKLLKYYLIGVIALFSIKLGIEAITPTD